MDMMVQLFQPNEELFHLLEKPARVLGGLRSAALAIEKLEADSGLEIQHQAAHRRL